MELGPNLPGGLGQVGLCEGLLMGSWQPESQPSNTVSTGLMYMRKAQNHMVEKNYNCNGNSNHSTKPVFCIHVLL